MDQRYAVLGPDNKALNFIVWDGETPFDYGQAVGNTLVLLPDGISYGFGWVWDGVRFNDPTPPPAPSVPEVITRRQCAMLMYSQGMITGAEAIAMTQTGTPPAAVQTYLDTLPEAQKVAATIDFAAMNYYRDNPLLLALMLANGMSAQQVDEFFIAASTI